MDLSDAYDVYDVDNEGPICRDCAAACSPATPVRCDLSWCRHGCHHLPPHAARALMADVERARAMDDRDQAALANVARDVEAESKPTLDELRRERFGVNGLPRRGAA